MSDLMTELRSNAAAGSHAAATEGSHAVIEIQKAFYKGNIPREAAISASTILLDISPAEANKLFPFVSDFARIRVKTWIVIAAALIGCCVGYVMGNYFTASVNKMFPNWGISTAQILASTTGVFLGAVLAVLGVFAWHRYAEKPYGNTKNA